MNIIIVSMSKMAISSNPDDHLITYALGSCIGIAVYDTAIHVGGLIHCMLPQSSIHKRKADNNPCMFVDTGLPFLLERMAARGCLKNNLVIRAAGAACMIPENNVFRIGENNHEVFVGICKKQGFTIASENIGGNHSRSLRLDIGTGKLFVKQNDNEVEL